MATTDKAPTFEAGLHELESLVRTLERAELPLEEAITAFERGMGLAQRLHAQLESVEQRVETLVREADGQLVRRPLVEGEER